MRRGKKAHQYLVVSSDRQHAPACRSKEIEWKVLNSERKRQKEKKQQLRGRNVSVNMNAWTMFVVFSTSYEPTSTACDLSNRGNNRNTLGIHRKIQHPDIYLAVTSQLIMLIRGKPAPQENEQNQDKKEKILILYTLQLISCVQAALYFLLGSSYISKY